ncbi:MAG: hypothetical protein AAF602_03125 [Myxococcota bacterium]
MNLTFTGSALSWSHRGHVLAVDVHAPVGGPSTPDGPLVEWEALARYLGSGADGARALLVAGDGGLDAGLCWSSLSGHAETAYSGLPAFVARFGAAGRLSQIVDRVTAVWRAVDAFGAPSVVVVAGACVRGGLDIVGTADEVVAERRPGLDDRLRVAGVTVSRWVAPGYGRTTALAMLGSAQPSSMGFGVAHASRQSV